MKGRNLGVLRGYTSVNGGHASESGNRGEVQSRERVEVTKSGAQRRFGKGPPRPRLPCAVTHLGLLSTSTPSYFRKQTSPRPRDSPATALRQSPKAPPPGPPLRPRLRAASTAMAARGQGADGAPPSFITAQWKGFPLPREAGLWAAANARRQSAAMSGRGGRST